MSGQHSGGDHEAASSPAGHGGASEGHAVQRALRIAQVYAQAVLDVVVLGAETDRTDPTDRTAAEPPTAARPGAAGPAGDAGRGRRDSEADR
ncbi:hypothetical protein [Actinacidiphila sp. bgisy167]|uniref:hypothetical protein n=1 Tax=Actinacidiphila sp. bgisy167 TaxID=3413797 RepID=UPI003D715BA2